MKTNKPKELFTYNFKLNFFLESVAMVITLTGFMIVSLALALCKVKKCRLYKHNFFSH